ncbi:MAG: hypothetical protein COC01_05255 [Bacteroidetes bacterium]|nr:MAG: hypothetical protein COC01_05255 [Bacteroidota bacterium]
MKKALIVTQKTLHNAPRVLKEIYALKDDFEIHTIGQSASGLEVAFYELNKISLVQKAWRLMYLKLGFFDKYYWDKHKRELIKTLSGIKYHLIIAHDEDMLPMALKLSQDSKIILNSHEYLPEEDNDNFLWRLLIKPYIYKLCKEYAPRADKMLSVNDGVAELYRENFNLTSTPILNAADYCDISPSKVELPVSMIHHGAAAADRKLELMVQTLEILGDGYSLDLLLNQEKSDPKCYKALSELAGQTSNVKIIAAVPYKEIIARINKYDLGLYILPPSNTNTLYALPNKFFEFIQARLAIAIGPSLEMAKIVKKYDLGVVAENFTPEAMANAIKDLSVEKIAFYKDQSHKHAGELSSEAEVKKIKEIVSQLI